MKVVINSCFGGFGLSIKAQKLYAKKSGFDLFFYKQTKYEWESGFDEYRKVSGNSDDSIFTHSIKKDLGETFTGDFPINDYWYYGGIDRTDPKLVEVVEELGKEADGHHAELNIIEIPDGIEYQISEYDGIEHVAEKHRTWS